MKSHEALLRLAVFLLALAGVAHAQSFPGRSWARAEAASLGWSVDKLAEAERYAADLGPTALMVVHRGAVIAASGDVTARVSLASVRKSLLSASLRHRGRGGAHRPQAHAGRTRHQRPRAGARRDRKACHGARSPDGALRRLPPGGLRGAGHEDERPARGSHAPGTFWYYNNWDFNALGTIYEKLTGARIFESFEQRIAHPTGMEDFSSNDGQYVHAPNSDHPAYVFAMSARDLARFGLLFLCGGVWMDKQIVPAAWVKKLTAALTAPADFGLDYGYMWWRVSDRAELGSLIGSDAYYALGYRGRRARRRREAACGCFSS